MSPPDAGEGVERAAVWTPGATNLVGRKFHQPGANVVKRNRIDYRAARVALEIGHITVFLNDEASVAVRAGGDFMGDDQVAALL